MRETTKLNIISPEGKLFDYAQNQPTRLVAVAVVGGDGGGGDGDWWRPWWW